MQLALPPLVGVMFATLLVSPAQRLDLPLTRLWPHQWPLAVQAVLMIAAVDFLRYWLHRFAHQNDVLWRLHAVHHSVDRLYWLNTARFHPLEKALQMCLDSLPFLLLGVRPEVLSLYYLAYSTNGFFQHSNIALRYGVLNYVVSSAEAHRWHHSREPREANSNYGSTTIVWDLLFGTFWLPKTDRVGALGLHDRALPAVLLGPAARAVRASLIMAGVRLSDTRGDVVAGAQQVAAPRGADPRSRRSAQAAVLRAPAAHATRTRHSGVCMGSRVSARRARIRPACRCSATTTWRPTSTRNASRARRR